MFASFKEFKFYQSFRIPVEEADDLRFLAEMDNELGKLAYIDDAKLLDISVTGLGFSTDTRIKIGTEITMSLQFKKQHLDITGTVVRAFSNTIEDNDIIYGIEIDEEKKINRFLQKYILSFSTERLKDCLVDSALKEKYTDTSEGFEMFSLLLSLFKDITFFGDKEGFVDNMLEEVIRVMNAQRSSIFLINPETNELEAVTALGVDKEKLKFDYRLGIAGSVFTTGIGLNIDTIKDSNRFNEDFDKMFDFETKSVICHPIHNREDKIIGVIEVINKRTEDHFTVEDEKTMKVLALIFSSVFHSYNPISEKSQIRKFSTPFDRKHALIGRTAHMSSLRNTILKVKDIESPVLIQGEHGVGKSLYARIIHNEGCRGLLSYEEVKCEGKDIEKVESMLFGPSEDDCVFTKNRGGTVYLNEVCTLPYDTQEKLFDMLSIGRIPDSNVTFDFRLICSISSDIGLMVDEGTFHKGFYEMISKAFIFIEPLRRRVEDVEHLVDYFLKKECQDQGLLIKSFSPKAVEVLKGHDWPGNIQELKVCVERAVLYNPKAHIITDVSMDSSSAPLFDMNAKQRMFGDIPHVSDFKVTLKDRIALVEREMIMAEIKRNNGNKSKAAKEMGISREALRKKLLMSSDIMQKLSGETVVVKRVEEKAAA